VDAALEKERSINESLSTVKSSIAQVLLFYWRGIRGKSLPRNNSKKLKGNKDSVQKRSAFTPNNWV
jgi:hypothetical protein